MKLLAASVYQAQRAMLAAALAASVAGASAGCLGDFALASDGGPSASIDAAGPHSDLAPALADVFARTVEPLLNADCAVCHAHEGGAGAAFMKSPAYATISTYPGMITRDPQASRLISKGKHEGPAFSSSELATVLAWLTAEAAALPPTMIDTAPATRPARPSVGANTVLLDGIGFPGASVTFDAGFAGASLVLSSLTLHAPPGQGLHVVHPLFVVWSGGLKHPDPVDSFSNLDETVNPGDAQPLGPGTLILDGVGSLDELSIAFLRIEASGGFDMAGMHGGSDGGVVAAGCKAVSAFSMDARPTMVQRCVGCHGGTNAGATAALDLTKLLDGTAQAEACAQTLTRVKPATPAQSGLFIATDPSGNFAHPYKFPDATTFKAFSQMATMWITQEK